VVGGLVVVVVQLGRGRAVNDVFGAYSFVGHLDYSAGPVVKWLLYQMAELDLYVGVLPAAALVLLVGQVRRAPARDQAFVAAACAVTAAFLVEVAMFASSLPWERRIAERSMFEIVPVLLISLLVWIERGLPRPRPAVTLAALAAAALPAVLPFGALLTPAAGSETLALDPWLLLREHGMPPEAVRVAVLAGSVAAAALFLWVPRRHAAVLPSVVLAYFALVLVGVQHQFRLAGGGALAAARDGGREDWIDDAVGPDAHAAVLWSGSTSEGTIWGTEFFNRGAGYVFDLSSPLPGDLPEEPVNVDGEGVVHDHLGRPVYGPAVLTDRSLLVAGTPVASSGDHELTLYHTEGPVRVLGRLTGRYAGDTWFRPTASFLRPACRAGTLVLEVEVDARRFPAGQRVTATVRGRKVAAVRVASGQTEVLTVPLAATRARPCTVTLRAARAAVEPTVGGPVGGRYTVLAWP
jgi:hypothetical protein